ncbi:1-acyl-sn-glycerol-3-phosphate acyltransferase [Rhodanobacter lindaniclasticus]|uniref:1-acyl-sn-glycerol-3-phosphate acyltransferase n=1 Tax=Rhodanobacter lindaniclasticus TaxID=75310 RepID=A0A4S3KG68_9GAMM|nr:lysophospholipid acyltransferase family protein [Rhodanobacter lindaniclasticus]THD07593.1 1-acyl-sn-glycerol-3-phosphate acyltransferase [Rhodanobacter lindaniclasticus]
MITARLLVGLVRLLVGAHGRWLGCEPKPVQRIYFANHSSHLDTLALWAALPPLLRQRTRPVAARDYWGKGGLRGFIAEHGFRAVYIERDRERREGDPLEPLCAALAAGDSLILFPEGTRSPDPLPQPFKAGLYHLARRHPQAELVAVYLDTLHRAMPKGSLLPVPLTCMVRFGRALQLAEGEDKESFLQRAHAAVVELA